MSKHNYSQYSNKNKTANNTSKPANKERPAAPTPEAEAKPTAVEPVVEPVIEPMIETVETVTLNKPVTGTVVDCIKLNVREEPSVHAEVLVVLDVASEVEVDVNNSTNEWLKICTTAGLEGYCMRKYINAHL